jgi:hypothetical protein
VDPDPLSICKFIPLNTSVSLARVTPARSARNPRTADFRLLSWPDSELFCDCNALT